MIHSLPMIEPSDNYYCNVNIEETRPVHHVHPVVDIDKMECSFHECVAQLLQYLDNNDLLPLVENVDTIDLNSEEFQARIISLRNHWLKQTYFLRTCFKGYAFHRCETLDFDQHSFDYLQSSGIYRLIKTINTVNPVVSHHKLMDMIDEIKSKLDDLYHSRRLTNEQYEQMRIHRSKVELNHLLFIYDKKGIMKNVRPVVVCKHGPTTGIALYLADLLNRLFTQVTHCRSFSNGLEVVETLEYYVHKVGLQSITRFVTFNIDEICSYFSHEFVIKTLEYFLVQYGNVHDLNGLSPKTIIELVRLVLNNQYFVYKNQLYQQILGSALGCPLTSPLACIYFCYTQAKWLNVLIHQDKHELFGRFGNEFFFTWNRTEEQLRLLLDGLPTVDLSKTYPIIPIKPTVTSKFHFVDIEIENRNGHLHTRIYHDGTFDQYELPNKLRYKRCLPSQLLQTMLMYFVRCCSDEGCFHYERRYLKLVYLFYGFSVHWIDYWIEQFFKEFSMSTRHYLIDRIEYERLRQRVIEHYECLGRLQKHSAKLMDNIQKLSYTTYWSSFMMYHFKQCLSNLFTVCFTYQPNFSESDIQIGLSSSLKQTPSFIVEHLLTEKPSRHILTLSKQIP